MKDELTKNIPQSGENKDKLSKILPERIREARGKLSGREFARRLALRVLAVERDEGKSAKSTVGRDKRLAFPPDSAVCVLRELQGGGVQESELAPRILAGLNPAEICAGLAAAVGAIAGA